MFWAARSLRRIADKALSDTIRGTGTVNVVPMFTAVDTIGDSPLTASGTSVHSTKPFVLPTVTGTPAQHALYRGSIIKCWGHATYVSGVPTLQVDHNITSVTDTATGRITWTWDRDFAAANYAAVPGVGTASGTSLNLYACHESAQQVGSVEISIHNENGTDTDAAFTSIIAAGDQ